MSFESGVDGASNLRAVYLRKNTTSRMCRLARLGLVSGGIAIAFAASPAHSYTLTDNYSGGNNTYNSPGDVIGTQTFDITSAVISRSGANNDTLNITINTYYAGAPGTAPADGTGYGSLFLSTNQWAPLGPAPYTGDTFATNNTNWNYAVTIPTNPGTTSGTSGLFSLGNGLVATYYPGTTVVQYYTTSTGQIVMSNVNGDPVTYPGANNPSYYFREGQAVQFKPNMSTSSVDPATWSVTPSGAPGSITFSIVDNGLFGNSFALAYAMTCANDVIQGEVTLASSDLVPPVSSTPLPAALPLFAGGLGVMGWFARRRKRNIAAA